MRFAVLLLLTTLASAETHPCKTQFSVIWRDSLNNVIQGLSPENEKWMREKMAKKYPDVCYLPPTKRPPLVLWITMSPATYQGTKTGRGQQPRRSRGEVENDLLSSDRGFLPIADKLSSPFPDWSPRRLKSRVPRRFSFLASFRRSVTLPCDLRHQAGRY